MPKLQKKVKASWTWAEIASAVQKIYDEYHHRDSWGVRVIYQESMIQHLKERLKKTRKSLPSKTKPKTK